MSPVEQRKLMAFHVELQANFYWIEYYLFVDLVVDSLGFPCRSPAFETSLSSEVMPREHMIGWAKLKNFPKPLKKDEQWVNICNLKPIRLE